MSVRHILAEKGNDVVTIAPGASLGEASALLASRKIGAVVVSADGEKVSGILSERDIIRAVSQEGGAALEAKVSRYMTANVVTCGRESEIDHLMQMMTDGKFRHVPVVEGESLVGIISIGDVVKRRLAQVEAEREALKDYIASA
jgi:CBS domain-containing protein